MIDACGFCGSDNTMEEFPGVFRCLDCRSIEVRQGTMTEEQYLDAIGEKCFSHKFVETGTKISWCKYCNVDATYVFERGEYISNDDIKLLQGLSSILSKQHSKSH